MNAPSGLALLEAMRDGRHPLAPAAAALDITVIEAAHGTATLGLPPRPAHANPFGIMHGGVITTALDSAMGLAVLSTLPAGRGFTTLELKVSFHRAVPTDAPPLRAEGRVLHGGRRIVSAEARLLGADGRLYASATSTLMMLDPPDAAPPGPGNGAG